jgi:hypothetical protein
LLNELLIFFLACFASRARAFSSVRIGARSGKKFRRKSSHPSPGSAAPEFCPRNRRIGGGFGLFFAAFSHPMMDR